jgi:SAM-dependent methyltransferase
MKFVKIDPPGQWCNYQAIFEMMKKCGGKTFVDVGCGAGELSSKLCKRGMSGIGVDFSEKALEKCKENMSEYIKAGDYKLIYGDALQLRDQNIKQDLAFSLMVMEHVQEDVEFANKISKIVKPGGHVILAVPGRMDRWGPEDDTVGHVRRYENYQLKKTLEDAGLVDVEVWSLAVPTGNILFSISNFLVKKSGELEKIKKMSMEEQTKTSGIRDIPFKTVFPSFFRIILNQYTLWPLFFMQRFFYKTNLGLTMLVKGRVPVQ